MHTKLSKMLHHIEFDIIDLQIRDEVRHIVHSRYIKQKSKLERLVKNCESANNRDEDDNRSNQHKFFPRVINLSKINLDEKENQILQKGLKYSPRMPVKQIDGDKLAVNIEIATKSITNHEEQHLAKLSLAKTIKKHFHNSYNKRPHNSEWNIIKKLKNKITTENIKVCKADKGNTITIMDEEEHSQKTLKVLRESDCSELKSDPTPQFQNQVINLLKKCNTVFCDSDKYRLKSMNPKSPQLFSQPKIHKTDCPMRPIVSYINAPAYKICKFLNKILPDVLKFESKYSVKNSIEFVNMANNVVVSNNQKLISFDVTSLFTSIPTEELKLILKNLLNDNETLNEIQRHDYMEIIEVCLSQNYFKFKNKFYKMNSGLPMGSPLSPLFANIYMNYVENVIMNNTKFNKLINFWCRYVDDIFCVWKGTERQLSLFLEFINNINKNIKFTIEKEQNNSINFLDLTVCKNYNKLSYKIYRKPTFTDAIIPYSSNQSFSIKMSAFHSMIHRLISIPLTTTDYKTEVATIKSIAANNGYKSGIIDKLIKKKNRKIITNKVYCDSKTIEPNLKWHFINFIPEINNKILRILNKNQIKTISANKNNLGSILSNNKEKIPKSELSGVYKITCDDCDAIYIGQTGRSFNNRIKEHQSAIRKQSCSTGFSEHCITNKHVFSGNFEAMHIIEKGLRLNLLESLEIRKAINAKEHIVNDQLDVCNSPLLNLGKLI